RLREQAGSHKVSAAAEHLRGSKTPPTCGSNPHGSKTPGPVGASLLTKRPVQSLKIYISVTPPSRASSLPQDQRCCRTSTWLENTIDLRSDPQGLKTRRTCGSQAA
ncbi:hypothetical protein ALP48_02475, partial [Pseudomonas syringae pv. solidagae]